MLQRRHSPFYNFIGDTDNGITMHWAARVDLDPPFAPWPELADISISNRCSKGCTYCYKDSRADGTLMSLEQYRFVLDALESPRWGNVFQVALGGGEPLEHPDFIAIIEETARRGIVANFTTNGMLLDNAVINTFSGKIGALALSVEHFNDLDETLIERLHAAGVRTNLHFILSDSSIEEAVALLDGVFNAKLAHINSIVFLTYKPAGRASTAHMCSMNEKLLHFINNIDTNRCSAGVGFDACFVPHLLRYTKVNTHIIDACECGFFSVYIDEHMVVKPCSFAEDGQFSYSLEEYTMQTIWDEKYGEYRKNIIKNHRCSTDCAAKELCRGHCPFFPEITLCYEQLPEKTDSFPTAGILHL